MLIACISLFMISLVSAALLSVKIQSVQILGLSLLIPAGTLAFCLTYAATDVISEVWGRGYALTVVLVGVAMRGVVFLLLLFALSGEQFLPFMEAAPFWTESQQEAYAFVFATGQRINFAGVIAFGISSVIDVLIFHWLRKRQEGRNLLWLRNNLSTIASQTLNSIVFITAAFWGAVPLAALGSLIAGQIVVKIAVAWLDTPLVYLARNIATGRKLLDWRG